MQRKKKMNLKKFLKYYLILTPILCILWKISPIEFSNSNTGRIVSLIIMISFALSLLIFLNLIAFHEKSIKENNSYLFFKVFLNIFYGSILFVILFFVWFGSSICGLLEIELFKFKNNPNVKIVKSSYDCGAFDSELSDYRIQKITPYTSFLQIRNKIDTNSIIKDEWIRSRNFMRTIRN